LRVFLILYWAQEKGFLPFSCVGFSCIEIRIIFLLNLFYQRLLFILYSGLSLGLPLLRFGCGSGQTEGKKVWRGTNVSK